MRVSNRDTFLGWRRFLVDLPFFSPGHITSWSAQLPLQALQCGAELSDTLCQSCSQKVVLLTGLQRTHTWTKYVRTADAFTIYGDSFRYAFLVSEAVVDSIVKSYSVVVLDPRTGKKRPLGTYKSEHQADARIDRYTICLARSYYKVALSTKKYPAITEPGDIEITRSPFKEVNRICVNTGIPGRWGRMKWFTFPIVRRDDDTFLLFVEKPNGSVGFVEQAKVAHDLQKPLRRFLTWIKTKFPQAKIQQIPHTYRAWGGVGGGSIGSRSKV